jgi:hypothetical protein
VIWDLAKDAKGQLDLPPVGDAGGSDGEVVAQPVTAELGVAERAVEIPDRAGGGRRRCWTCTPPPWSLSSTV